MVSPTAGGAADLFGREVRERVRQAIEEAERATAGEIRVLVVERSTGVDPFAGTAAGLLVAAIVYLLLARAAWGHPDRFDLALAAACGLAAYALAGYSWGRAGADRAVRRRAEREFIELGIGGTQGRTGVLLMLSLAERRAVLLADRAIDEKVAPGTWDRVVARAAAALGEGRPAEGIAVAVSEIGAILAQHFPRRPDDRDELPDELVVKR